MASKNQNLVNIPKDVDDAHFRYKRELLVCKVEGRGNGIKTVVENMANVAKSLARRPEYPTKFFGFELGAQTTLDAAKDRWIVNGKHTTEDMERLLELFIAKYVLCGTCRNPETTMTLLASGNIDMRCKACGNTTRADPVHKLTAYIIKTPPTVSAKEAKIAAKINAQKAQVEASTDGVPIASDDRDDGTWAQDTSAEAVEKRRLDLLGNTLAKTLVSTGDEDGEGAQGDGRTPGMKELSEMVAATPAPKVIDVAKKVKALQASENWKDTRLVQVLFACFIDSTKDIAKLVKARAQYFAPFVKDETNQKMLLFCWERLCEVEPAVVAKSAVVLKAFYDADILDEEVLIKWNKHSAKKIDPAVSKSVREAAAAFITWLEQADEDDD